jgi:hypothetical protein
MQGCGPCELASVSNFICPIGNGRKGGETVIVDMKRIIWEENVFDDPLSSIGKKIVGDIRNNLVSLYFDNVLG